MTKVLMIAFMMIFTQNYVLVQFVAICPFLGVSQKFDSCIGMSGAVIFVMTLASAVTWLIYHYVMIPLGLAYLSTIIFILVIAALVQFVEIFLKKFVKPLYNALGIYLPLITTNCAVLGVAIQVVTNEYDFGAGAHMLSLGQSVVFAVATAIGYGLALTLFAGIREQLELSNVPKAFKGVPIALLTAGIMAMAFIGFSGLV